MSSQLVSIENINIYNVNQKQIDLGYNYLDRTNADISQSLFDIFKNIVKDHSNSSETLSKIDLATFQKKEISQFTLQAPDSYQEIIEKKNEKKLALLISIFSITLLAAGILIAVFISPPDAAAVASIFMIAGHLVLSKCLLGYVLNQIPRISCRRFPKIETVANVSIGLLIHFTIGPFLALIKAASTKIPSIEELEGEKAKVLEEHKELQTYLENLFACYEFLRNNPDKLNEILAQYKNRVEIVADLNQLEELFYPPPHKKFH